MRYENYLVSYMDRGRQTYKLARGYKLDEDKRLAYCKLEEGDYRYCIIDVASGLFVVKATSKKKLFAIWKDKSSNPEFIQAIINARKTRSYINRVAEASADKKIWRDSGYIIEGRGFEL